MDSSQSYFVRTHWFIWIGFTTSILVFGFLGFVGSLDHQAGEASVAPSLRILVATLTIVGSALGFWFGRRARSFSPKAGQTKSDAASGMATVFYSLQMTAHESFGLVAFVIGFLHHDLIFMLPYLALALVLNLFNTPLRLN